MIIPLSLSVVIFTFATSVVAFQPLPHIIPPTSSPQIGATCQAATSTATATTTSSSQECTLQPRRILVMGGSGRVGGSTVRALKDLGPEMGWNLTLAVGGRNANKLSQARARWGELKRDPSYGLDVGFVQVDQEVEGEPLLTALRQFKPDLIVNTAGPFQCKKKPEMLRAALELGIPYMDVCDDIALSKQCKALHGLAVSKGIPTLISTGVWPGISSLMAADVIETLGGPSQTDKIDFQFFTAGSGNAGTTILSATFLILSEKVLSFVKDAPMYFPPASEPRDVDFGQTLGTRQIFRMNLIEAFTCHEVFGVPNISTYFGTAPQVWNLLLRAMAMLPSSILRNRDLMQGLAIVSEPVVRLVDALVGSANAMRVDGVSKDGRTTATAIYAHPDLEECVGLSVAAFAMQMLERKVPPGVHFPEEVFSPSTSGPLFDIATRNCFLWERPERPR